MRTRRQDVSWRVVVPRYRGLGGGGGVQPEKVLVIRRREGRREQFTHFGISLPAAREWRYDEHGMQKARAASDAGRT